MRIYRQTADGRKWRPSLQDGHFVLGDPSKAQLKHHAANQVHVPSEDEAIALLHKGFSIRVETDTSPSLVRKNVFVDGTPLD